MTGFASVDGTLEDGRGLSLTVKSVNHRHLDLSLRLPAGFGALEPVLRKAVKARLRRGHVELTLTLERPSGTGALTLDEPLLQAYAATFRKAATVLGVAQEPQVEALLRMTGVLSAHGPAEDFSGREAVLLPLLEEILSRHAQARLAEGEALAQELRDGMARVAALAAEARALRSGVAAAEFERLKLKMAELLAVADISEDRLLQEAALLAGRSDVEEELVRLTTHIERFVHLLHEGGDVGRPLDFLLQEMNREANTTLSKTGASAGEAGLRLTEIGLAVKMELERAREQVQNLE